MSDGFPSVLEGVVQLDHTAPLRVCLDTSPVTMLSIDWRDVVGCYQVRLSVDKPIRNTSVVLDILCVRHYGLFVRVPGQDAFWPGAELYGYQLECMSAVAQRAQRAQRPQLKLQHTALPDLGNAGTKLRQRKKGRR